MTVRLGYDLHGDADAPVLILGSSLGTTRRMWQPQQLETFAQRFRVVRYEHRGHGESPSPSGPYGIEDLGGDVLDLLGHLGVERFAYAGVSLGGMVGLWLASQVPDRVERLAVVCTSAAPGSPDAWRERAAAVRSAGMAPIARAVTERWFTPRWSTSHADPVDRLTADFTDAVDPEGYAGCCEALATLDLRPRLTSITAPTLVVAGAEDLALPPEPHARVIADTVGGARLEVLDHAAHLATVERADVCTPLLLAHLGGVA
jgi:3-oxoadipate enol-lactonase